MHRERLEMQNVQLRRDLQEIEHDDKSQVTPDQ